MGCGPSKPKVKGRRKTGNRRREWNEYVEVRPKGKGHRGETYVTLSKKAPDYKARKNSRALRNPELRHGGYNEAYMMSPWAERSLAEGNPRDGGEEDDGGQESGRPDHVETWMNDQATAGPSVPNQPPDSSYPTSAYASGSQAVVSQRNASQAHSSHKSGKTGKSGKKHHGSHKKTKKSKKH